MEEKILFRVLKSFSLPGLGVLLLPENPVADLAQTALHSALRVTLRHLGAGPQAAIATVEEIARPGETATRALLLTQDGAEPVPAGTEVWWSGWAATWEELL